MDISWYWNRLRAMSRKEIAWRISQKGKQNREKAKFAGKNIPVIATVFRKELRDCKADTTKLFLNKENKHDSVLRCADSIRLLGPYSYETYKRRWHAGFQTEADWPLSFSYKLNYKGRDDIGDARTNWELHRHFQFPLIAKSYYVTGKRHYLEELKDLFYDWNQANPFLMGIAWTSVMEVAIRLSNWVYTLGFLQMAETEGYDDEDLRRLKDALSIGILNMADYVGAHYSRFSSANNHVIVEAYAIGLSGILYTKQEWVDLAISILCAESARQNFSDGVNREVSLHYQAFFMEAAGLFIRLLRKNEMAGHQVEQEQIEEILLKMARYTRDCVGKFGEIIEFGDDDAGKILDFTGIEEAYVPYVLELMSLILPEQFIRKEAALWKKPKVSETINWLFTKAEIDALSEKETHRPNESRCYKEGGVTLLKSLDGSTTLGIDHGPLGFGSIAAHGHADALSLQLFFKGKGVFVDAGTYIYHCEKEARNAFRDTAHHNTMQVDGRNQSEMLGAFLWGKRAESKLLCFESDGKADTLEISQDGYTPVIHNRKVTLRKEKGIVIIEDTLENDGKEAEKSLKLPSEITWTLRFILGRGITPLLEGNTVEIDTGREKMYLTFESIRRQRAVKLDENGIEIEDAESLDTPPVTFELAIEETEISSAYGEKETTKVIVLSGRSSSEVTIRTRGEWKDM